MEVLKNRKSQNTDFHGHRTSSVPLCVKTGNTSGLPVVYQCFTSGLPVLLLLTRIPAQALAAASPRAPQLQEHISADTGAGKHHFSVALSGCYCHQKDRFHPLRKDNSSAVQKWRCSFSSSAELSPSTRSAPARHWDHYRRSLQLKLWTQFFYDKDSLFHCSAASPQ